MPISPLNRVLIAICGMLLLISLGLWVIPLGTSVSVPADTSSEIHAPMVIETSLPLAVTDNLVNRPVFDPSRHSANMAISQVPVTSSSATLTLAGLIVGAGTKVALIRSSDSKNLVPAHEGDIVSNWVVKSIRADGVVVVANGTSQVLKFPTRAAAGGSPGGGPGAGFGGGPGAHSY